MKIIIRTVAEQWKEYLDDFMKADVKAMAIESDSYDKESLYRTARKYVRQYDLPVKVNILWGTVRLERTDM